MCVGNMIDLQDLPGHLQAPVGVMDRAGEELLTLDAVQQQYLLRVLDLVKGNKAKAAEILGVGRNTVYQMLSRISENSNPTIPRNDKSA